MQGIVDWPEVRIYFFFQISRQKSKILPSFYSWTSDNDFFYLLVLPSLTEISPNTALEAKAAGLPVLLTHQHGLGDLSSGMIDSTLYNISDIVDGIAKARTTYVANYSTLASRPWSQVASETVNLFATLLRL